MKPKYELIPEGRLFRLRALRDFGNIQEGEFGGLVAGKHNLSHEGSCWIYRNAGVFDKARVSENARIYGRSRVYDNCRVSGNARIHDNTRIYDHVRVCDEARIYDNVRACGDVKVYGKAQAHGGVIITKCLHIQQPKHNITVTDDHIFIGCQGHTWQYWNKNIVAIGKEYGYTDQEIKETKALLIILCNKINNMKRKANAA